VLEIKEQEDGMDESGDRVTRKGKLEVKRNHPQFRLMIE
jgi:hypothetical protein